MEMWGTVASIYTIFKSKHIFTRKEEKCVLKPSSIYYVVFEIAFGFYVKINVFLIVVVSVLCSLLLADYSLSGGQWSLEVDV